MGDWNKTVSIFDESVDIYIYKLVFKKFIKTKQKT